MEYMCLVQIDALQTNLLTLPEQSHSFDTTAIDFLHQNCVLCSMKHISKMFGVEGCSSSSECRLYFCGGGGSFLIDPPVAFDDQPPEFFASDKRSTKPLNDFYCVSALRVDKCGMRKGRDGVHVLGTDRCFTNEPP